MRTLKKTLCVILCLAMMVGLCAIGANAITFDDYKDKEKIKYENAVTLLTALKVLEGDEKGGKEGGDNVAAYRTEGAKDGAKDNTKGNIKDCKPSLGFASSGLRFPLLRGAGGINLTPR